MTIVQATNCNRTYAAKAESLTSDFESEVIDFKDMPMGMIHCRWFGAAGSPLDGSFKIYCSAFPDIPSFDVNGTEIQGSEIIIHGAGDGGRPWVRDRLAFRYALVRYTAGSMSAGTVDIVAIGKKS